MSELDIINENFFIIDSFNLDYIKPKFYGYAIQNNDFIENNDLTPEMQLSKLGAYINVETDDDTIYLSQDFNGSYGLYLYQSNVYFAISNSFIKLVEYLKKITKLSLNKDYADAFLFTDLCSNVYEETLVNEIKMLPRNVNVIINKKTKNLSFEYIDYEEHTIDVDSPEGIASLDKWFDKWINIIRSIRSKTNNISFGLSGGFDTRVVAALWLNANINLDNIRINSEKSLIEDYKIASEISKEFNFNLNNPLNIKTKVRDLDDTINSSFYVKLGFHKELYYKNYSFLEPLYSFGGHGGEYIRGSPNRDVNSHIEGLLYHSSKGDSSLINPTRRLAEKSLKKISESYACEDEHDITERWNKEVRHRNHHGKECVEAYLSNFIKFTSLMDSDLHKLNLSTSKCDDKKLLITLILSRYCPKLLEFEVEGGREFNKDTIAYANEINRKYPFIKKEYTYIEGPKKSENKFSNTQQNNSTSDPNKFIEDIFYSKQFRKDFENYYSPKIYNKIKTIAKTKKRHPLTEVHSAIAIMKIIKDIEFNQYNRYATSFDWLNTFDIGSNDDDYGLPENMKKYVTARIDIKNNGSSENNIEIIENSDVNSMVINPNWFKNEEGIGTLIQSTEGNIHLKLKCIKDGKLKIALRGIDFKDENKNRIPIYIKYSSFIVNDESLLEKPTLNCHDKFYLFEKNVKDGEIVNIIIQWSAM